MTNISKNLTVHKIQITNLDDSTSIKEALANQPIHNIDIVNWVKEFPSKPKVSFTIAHCGSHLFLQYFVEENEILAKVKEDNGEVWTDSCVEFFLSLPSSNHYYNTEFTCIGKGLLGHREKKENAEHAPQSVMNDIKRFPSLGSENFDKKQGDFKWDLLLVIPTTTYWKDELKTFDGLKAKANFYKCGDNLTKPHFLSWNPIKTETPNFHQPVYFGELNFE